MTTPNKTCSHWTSDSEDCLIEYRDGVATCSGCGQKFVPSDVLEGLVSFVENFQSSLNRLGGGCFEDDVRRNRLAAKEIAVALRERIGALGPR